MIAKLSLIPAGGALLFAGISLFDAAAPIDFQPHAPVAGSQSEANMGISQVSETAPLPFAPVFGLPSETAPELHAKAEDTPTKPDVKLTGVLVSGETRWAILDASTGSLVLREGDLFADGVKVARVAADHVEVEKEGAVHKLVFSKATPSTGKPAKVPGKVLMETAAESAGSHRKMVRSVEMSRDDVEALVALARLR